MPYSFDHKTGELLVAKKDGTWVKPARADDPQNGDRFFHDGEEWKPVPLTDQELADGRMISLAQGTALNYGDEFIAAAQDPASAMRAAVGAEPQTGGYYKNLADIRARERRYNQEEPGVSLGINLIGGIPTALATGGGAVVKGLTSLQRIKAAATTGAKIGAVAGFGAGEGGLEGRLPAAGGGAVAGAAIGSTLQALSPLAQPLYRAIRGGARNLWDNVNMTFTTEGRRIAINANMDPDAISAELAQVFAREAATATNPTHAAALADARSLPVPVPLTTGQVTGNAGQMLREDIMRQGTRGPGPEQIMGAADEAQRQALNANLEHMQGQIAGPAGTRPSSFSMSGRPPAAPNGAPVVTRGEGMAMASQTVNRRADVFERRVDGLYNAARQGGDAGIERGAWLQGTQDVRNAVTSDFHPDNVPKVWGVVSRLFGVGNHGEPQTPLVSSLFQARRELTGLQADGGVEAAAASRAKAALDRWINGTARQSLEGDTETINRWYRAIGARREYGKKFGAGIVADLVEKDPRAGWRLVIDPQEAATRLLGDGSKGLNTKGDLFRDLVQLRSRLGQDSEPWKGVRQEIFMRLAREARGNPMNSGGYTFNAPKFIKAWDDFLEKSPRLSSMLFTQSERNVMNQFRRVVSQTLIKPGGRQLGSAAAMQQSIATVFPFLAKALRFTAEVPGIKGALQAPASAAARGAVAGNIPQQRLGYGARNILVNPAVSEMNKRR